MQSATVTVSTELVGEHLAPDRAARAAAGKARLVEAGAGSAQPVDMAAGARR